MGESATAAALTEAAFIGIAETLPTPIRLIPNTPTAARMIRIVFPPLVIAFISWKLHYSSDGMMI
jgi:hypothetical protein